jgi:hypothetical protein
VAIKCVESRGSKTWAPSMPWSTSPAHRSRTGHGLTSAKPVVSRITLTEPCWPGSKAVSKAQVLISGSAVGWYGDGGERELTEDRR